MTTVTQQQQGRPALKKGFRHIKDVFRALYRHSEGDLTQAILADQQRKFIRATAPRSGRYR